MPASTHYWNGDLMLVMVNVDNVAGEAVPYIIEKLMNLGAESVYAIPAITKKGRPGFIFLIDTAREKVEAIGDFLAREIGTLGLRLFEEVEHIKFNYEMKRVKLSLKDDVTDEGALNLAVGVKVIHGKDGSVASVKAEYEELKAAASALTKAGMNVSLTALKEMIEASVLKGEGRVYQNLSVELVS
ncbi:MAG TPA: DUF111 family protein [Anaerolineae bacterium]|nr:DUF111 family protein [Anaerolineae bacterium]